MKASAFDYLKYVLPYRRRLQARGLTVLGRPRVRRAHPELRGLPRRNYLTALARLRRQEARR